MKGSSWSENGIRRKSRSEDLKTGLNDKRSVCDGQFAEPGLLGAFTVKPRASGQAEVACPPKETESLQGCWRQRGRPLRKAAATKLAERAAYAAMVRRPIYEEGLTADRVGVDCGE